MKRRLLWHRLFGCSLPRNGSLGDVFTCDECGQTWDRVHEWIEDIVAVDNASFADIGEWCVFWRRV